MPAQLRCDSCGEDVAGGGRLIQEGEDRVCRDCAMVSDRYRLAKWNQSCKPAPVLWFGLDRPHVLRKD